MKNSVLLRAFLLLASTAALLAAIPGELVLAGPNSSSAGPQITLIPSAGHVGDNVQLVGNGFVPDQNIIISIDGSSILSYLSGWDGRWPVMSETDGSFGAYLPGKVVCNVPNLPGGVHIVTAQDDAGDTATANITVLPKLTISKLQGAMGVQVTTSGSGLQANVTLSISFNSVVVTTTKTDALGAFTQKFTVPAVPNGSYDVKITDGTTTQDFSFAVQSNLPATSRLISPDNEATLKMPVDMAWSEVAGVTYELEVSTDSGFATLALNQKEIGAASYRITGKTPLANGQLCYWRVQAMDQAGNAGAWSATGTFRVTASRPGWLIPSIIGMALALLAAFYYIWSRRQRAARS